MLGKSIASVDWNMAVTGLTDSGWEQEIPLRRRTFCAAFFHEKRKKSRLFFIRMQRLTGKDVATIFPFFGVGALYTLMHLKKNSIEEVNFLNFQVVAAKEHNNACGTAPGNGIKTAFSDADFKCPMVNRSVGVMRYANAKSFRPS
jgi:hypothetical protein